MAIACHLDIVLIVYTAACMNTSLSTQAFARLGREGSLTYDNECMDVGGYPRSPNQGRQGRILGGFWDNKAVYYKAVYFIVHCHLYPWVPWRMYQGLKGEGSGCS